MRRLLASILALFSGARAEQELDDELRAYLNLAADAHRQQGLSEDAALRQARLSLGSITSVKQAVRDVGWESRIDSLQRDVHFACRSLLRAPAFTTAAVLTLALGIGVNSTIFSLVNALLLRPLPVAAPDRLVSVSTRNAVEHGYLGGWPYSMWDQIRQQEDLFESAVAWTVLPQRLDLSQRGEQQPVDGLFVSGRFFQDLGVRIAAGRAFVPEEDVLGSARSHVAIVSDGFWRRRLGRADVVGTSLMVNRVPVTIIGVAPPDFLGPEVGRTFDVALPVGAAPAVLHSPDWGSFSGPSYLAVMLRLRPGGSSEAVAGALHARQRQLIERSLPPKTFWGPVQDGQLRDPFAVTPAWAGISELRRQYSGSLTLLAAIAAFVLVIACVNVASLLLARTTAQHHEFSVRLALGAPWQRIVQQHFVANLLLAAAGTAMGLGVALWCSRLLVAQLSTWSERVALDVSPDWRFVMFGVAGCVATALLFGTLPAIRAARMPAGEAGRLRSTTSAGRPLRLHKGLVVLQIALSVVLLVTATLLVRSFQELGRVPLGFQSDRVLIATVDGSRAGVGRDARALFWSRLADVVGAVPGVAQAAVSLNTPLNGGITAVSDFTARGGADVPASKRRAIVNVVTPGWFETYATPVRSGRTFDRRDTTGAPAVLIVNDAFARRFFPRGNALGSTIVNATLEGSGWAPPSTVVGIVGDSVSLSLRAEPFPMVYQPIAQFAVPLDIREFSITVRTRGDRPAQLAGAIGAALNAAHPDLSFSFHVLADQVEAARHHEKLVTSLASAFGAVALALALVGIYGVTAYALASRRTELGVRMALGARPRDVIGAVVRDTVVTLAPGVFAGILMAAAASGLLRSELFGIEPLDLVTFSLVPVALTTIALVACYVPARRAASIDPMLSLRCE